MHARQVTLKKSGSGKPPTKQGSYKFSVLFMEDPEGWSAQVLEHDIATQADSLEDLFYEVERILFSHFALAKSQGRVPFENLSPAPAKFWDVFNKSQIFMSGPKMDLRQKTASPPRIEKDIRIARKRAA